MGPLDLYGTDQVKQEINTAKAVVKEIPVDVLMNVVFPYLFPLSHENMNPQAAWVFRDNYLMPMRTDFEDFRNEGNDPDVRSEKADSFFKRFMYCLERHKGLVDFVEGNIWLLKDMFRRGDLLSDIHGYLCYENDGRFMITSFMEPLKSYNFNPIQTEIEAISKIMDEKPDENLARFNARISGGFFLFALECTQKNREKLSREEKLAILKRILSFHNDDSKKNVALVDKIFFEFARGSYKPSEILPWLQGFEKHFISVNKEKSFYTIFNSEKNPLIILPGLIRLQMPIEKMKHWARVFKDYFFAPDMKNSEISEVIDHIAQLEVPLENLEVLGQSLSQNPQISDFLAKAAPATRGICLRAFISRAKRVFSPREIHYLVENTLGLTPGITSFKAEEIIKSSVISKEYLR